MVTNPLILAFLICSLDQTRTLQPNNHAGFKRIEVSCSDVLEESTSMKTLVECCGFCLTFENCQGVKYNDTFCQALTNLTCCTGRKHEAWVDKRIIEELEIKRTSREYLLLIDKSLEFGRLTNYFCKSIND